MSGFHNTDASIRIHRHRNRVCLEISQDGELVFQRYLTTFDARKLVDALTQVGTSCVMNEATVANMTPIEFEVER